MMEAGSRNLINLMGGVNVISPSSVREIPVMLETSITPFGEAMSSKDS